MGKWDEIMDFETENLEDMIEFSTKYLTGNETEGAQIVIIPYIWLDNFINGEKSYEDAPTKFVVSTNQSKKVEDVICARINTYIEYSMWVFIFSIN